MADVTIGAKITVDGGDATNSVKNFKKELVLAQAEVVKLSEKFGATSREAADAAKKAAELKGKIGDAKSLVDAFNPDTKFRAFGASINTVVGGFSALQGVMGLVGSESEDVQKALLKVQSALSISQGLAQLQEGITSFKNLGSVIKATTIFQKANTAATVIASAVMRALGASTLATGTAFKIVRGIIISTGIGALIAGIGFLVSKIIEWTEATDETATAQEKLNKSIEKQNALLDKNLSKIKFNTDKKLLLGKIAGDSEEKLRNISLEGLLLEADALDTDLVKKKKNALDLRALAGVKAEDVKAADAEIEKARKAHQDKLNEIELFGLQTEVAINEKFREDKKKAEEKRLKDDEIAFQIKLEKGKERLAAEAAAFAKSGGAGGNLKIEIPKSIEQIQTENAVAAANKAFIEKENIFLKESDLRSKSFTDIKDKDKEEELLRKLKFENTQQVLDATSKALGAFSELVGSNTAAGKIFAIAGATVDTYRAVVAALASTPPPFNYIQAATVGALGLANIKKIISVKVPGKSVGGSAPESAAVNAPLTPQKPQVGTTALDQNSLNAIGNATTRAYVLETDITNNQERVTRLNRQARLGG